eukprot:3573405-Pyramimonas_sp.AAC.1
MLVLHSLTDGGPRCARRRLTLRLTWPPLAALLAAADLPAASPCTPRPSAPFEADCCRGMLAASTSAASAAAGAAGPLPELLAA